MRVGWFGGSFDPPHKGHGAVARAAADAFGLAEVLFAPVGRQPLKDGGAEASFADRLAMVELICREDSRFRASGLDGPREDGGVNYTVDALRVLVSEKPEVEVFGILGMDAFLQMPHWREPERLRAMADWVVVTRPGYVGEAELWGERVHLLENVFLDISATRLRERLRNGEDCGAWVDGTVLSYIELRGLYRRFGEP